MKIIHIITGLATGGAERALYNLLQGGLNTHFDNHIISLSNADTMGPQISALGVPVATLGMRGGRPSLSSLIKLHRTIKKLSPDLLQGWMYHGNLAATLARKLAPGNPALVWNTRHSLYDLAHEKLMTRQVIRANRFFSSSPDALLYNSELSRKQHEAFGYVSLNGRVIPNGIDLQRFSFSDKARKHVRAELGIPTEAYVVGHVARFHPIKGHSIFLRAAEAVALRYPDLHFLLSGRDVSMSNASLEKQVPAMLRNRFHLLGERSDVPGLMSAMDVFCQSSWSEAFPNVLGEAMAVGVPCVATDVGDSAIIVGDTGVMVPPGDDSALATGIEYLLTMPLVKRRMLGENARARIESNFTLGAIVEQYVALYEKVMIEKRER